MAIILIILFLISNLTMVYFNKVIGDWSQKTASLDYQSNAVLLLIILFF